jgi:hypothetical protein
MGADLAEQASALLTAEGSRVEIVDGAGHFLHLEISERVNTLVLEHVTS